MTDRGRSLFSLLASPFVFMFDSSLSATGPNLNTN
jgi:hypothetical protein